MKEMKNKRVEIVRIHHECEFNLTKKNLFSCFLKPVFRIENNSSEMSI